ncbi:hypothetical protein O3M35_004221 [Rhynocoris fuscipes]|uniref:Uncharacterized protein n=1 Tax=Rhynocoris fuscipes TaxID=488301 RepID=A0AAW1CGK4_9HEMI
MWSTGRSRDVSTCRSRGMSTCSSRGMNTCRSRDMNTCSSRDMSTCSSHVYMTKPDDKDIAQVILHCEGFKLADEIGSKLVTLFDMAR